jgi:hypothetical protein
MPYLDIFSFIAVMYNKPAALPILQIWTVSQCCGVAAALHELKYQFEMIKILFFWEQRDRYLRFLFGFNIIFKILTFDILSSKN